MASAPRASPQAGPGSYARLFTAAFEPGAGRAGPPDGVVGVVGGDGVNGVSVCGVGVGWVGGSVLDVGIGVVGGVVAVGAATAFARAVQPVDAAPGSPSVAAGASEHGRRIVHVGSGGEGSEATVATGSGMDGGSVSLVSAGNAEVALLPECRGWKSMTYWTVGVRIEKCSGLDRAHDLRTMHAARRV